MDNQNKKKIRLVATGGTIASEMTPSGLAPELNPQQLLSFIPRIAEVCEVECLQLYSLDSTNIRPQHWLGIAQAVRENYDQYDGFVISHGTDTMAYTAAALRALGFTLTDSVANFLFARPADGIAEGMYTALRERGILVRYFSGERVREYLRITVGTREQMDALLCAIREILCAN